MRFRYEPDLRIARIEYRHRTESKPVPSYARRVFRTDDESGEWLKARIKDRRLPRRPIRIRWK